MKDREHEGAHERRGWQHAGVWADCLLGLGTGRRLAGWQGGTPFKRRLGGELCLPSQGERQGKGRAADLPPQMKAGGEGRGGVGRGGDQGG